MGRFTKGVHSKLRNGGYAARGVGDGNFVPQLGQFAQPNSTLRPQFGQVGSSEVPQCGQNVYPDFRTCEHPGHGFISGSRRMK
jgi:hypothetical protein